LTGIFVAVEGPNGVGKSTVIATASVALARSLGRYVYATKEPSATPLGQAIRELEPVLPPEALALACAADRVDHIAREIEPRLAEGAVVVSDRYVPSSLVLQQLDGLTLDFIWAINKDARPPDLTVYLEDEPARIDKRIAARGGTRRFESAGNAAHELVLYRDARNFLCDQGWKQETIECAGLTAEDVAERLVNVVASWVGGIPPAI
jgi:dTMP kinase